MEAIGNFLKDNQKLILGLSTSTLIGYLLFRGQIWSKPSASKKKHLLQVSLPELINSSNHANIVKIVITTCSNSKGLSRKNLINHVKSKLMQRGVKVLINCSPLKLLKAGCECFLDSMQSNDGQYVDYYYNALKTQFLIEDTISNIQLINEQDNQIIVMICDTNAFDLKLMNQSEALWSQFLNKYNIDENKLLNNYDLIIHGIQKDSDVNQDSRIENVWREFPNYHKVVMGEGMVGQNFDYVMTVIDDFLNRKKQRIVAIGGN